MQECTLREAVARVRGEFKLFSADTFPNISDRFIASELQSSAILFIKQVTDKRKLWNSPNIFTTISCLQLKQVPIAECCSYTSSCTVARTVVKLPKIAEGNNFGMLIQGLYSIDTISRKFIESTPDRYANSLHLGAKGNQVHFWIQDKYLYIGDDKIERVKLSAYFEEDMPESLISYPDYCGQTLTTGCCPSSDQTSVMGQDMSLCCPTNPLDEPFKAPGYLVDSICTTVAKKLLETYKRSEHDNTSNYRDETK